MPMGRRSELYQGFYVPADVFHCVNTTGPKHTSSDWLCNAGTPKVTPMIFRLCRMRYANRFRICRAAMTLALASLLAAPCSGDSFGQGDQQFDISFVTIGDAGNAPDLDNNPRSYQGYAGVYPVGDVSYVYRIGKYEISRGDVDKANALGNLGITLIDMSQFDNGPELPATGINWFEAATFVNWLNSSTGYTEAYKVRAGEFQNWEPTDAGYDPNNVFRNRLARYFLPSVDEWYKAAFYDPKSDVYYQYATGSDSPPARVANGTAPESAVYHRAKPAPVTSAGGLSPYGTMAQSGNAWEWEETQYSHTNMNIQYGLRGLRGGDWDDDEEHISANYRNPFPAYVENQLNSFGFRVASVASPAAVGDFNANGVMDAADIDRMTLPSKNLTLDLTQDGAVDVDDRNRWVHVVASTWYGDTNLDGQFNSSDLVIVFEAGAYEDAIEKNSGWNTGDWDGDADFTSSDLVVAFQDGGYERGLRPSPPAVPEPTAGMLTALLVAWSGFAVRTRR